MKIPDDAATGLPGMSELISMMWHASPELRPTCEEILSDLLTIDGQRVKGVSEGLEDLSPAILAVLRDDT